MARPKKTLEQAELLLPTEYKADILAMYKEGYSDEEIQAYFYEKLGSMSFDLWERWLQEEPEFSQLIKYGQLLSLAWWKSHGRREIKNKEFNNVLWYMNMKNRFGWSDNQNIKHSGTIEHVGIIRTPEKKQLDAPEDNILIKEAITEEL
jgi:hypothetical protein